MELSHAPVTAELVFGERIEEVPAQYSPMPHHKAGLSCTASGYGHKLPTRYKVHYNGRWYRVYSCCFSNVSREYIVSRGLSITVDLSY